MTHRGGTLDDRCHMCHGRVYLLERHYNAAGQLYHRHCYRGYQRSAALWKSKQSSDKENADKPSSNGSTPSSGKIGMGGSSKAANYLQSSGSSAAQESRLTSAGGMSPARGTRSSACSTVVCSPNVTTSSRSTGLIKALYSAPVYKQAVTTVSVTPTASNVNANVARLRTTSSSTSIAATVSRSNVLTVTPTATVAGVTVSKTSGSSPSVFAAARSQYLQRVGGLSTPATITSTPTIFTPSYINGKVGRNVTSAARTKLEASSSGAALSRVSQPLIGCVVAGGSHATNGLKVTASATTTSYRTFTCGSVGNVAARTCVSGACVAGTKVTWSPAVANYPSTRVTTSSTVPSAGDYVSSLLNDRMLPATATTRFVPMTSLYTSDTKLAAVTSRHQTTATTASYTVSQPLTAPRVSTQQHISTKNSVNSSENDAAMINSILQRLAEVRERKEQSRFVSNSAVERSPAESVVPSCNISPVTLSAGSRMTINSRAGTLGTATSQKTEWQLEAERRHAERNGVYVDPEKQKKETLRQQTSPPQLPDLHGSSYRSALSRVPPSTLGIQSKMRSAASSVEDATVISGMYLMRPTPQQVTAAHVTDGPPVHLQAASTPQDHFKSRTSTQSQQDLLRRRKSASIALGAYFSGI